MLDLAAQLGAAARTCLRKCANGRVPTSLILPIWKSFRTARRLANCWPPPLAVRNRPRELIKERIEDTGRHVVHRMERYLNTLGTIALIGPLLGLFGTVIGLIRMFMQVMVGGMADPTKMAGGIGEALICTAAGLTVAIPAYVLHRYFRSKVAGYCVEMEKQATLLLDDLTISAPAAAPPVRVVRR